MNKPLTDEAHILFIELIVHKQARAKMLRGSAKAWQEGRNDAKLWDAAAEGHRKAYEAAERELNRLGYTWGGDPVGEWPELIE